jgi:perosamine synthetase
MKVFCYGASGHGKVVADIIAFSGMELLGFVDDDDAKTGTRVGGIPVIGTAAALPDLMANRAAAIVTIGSNQVRTAKAKELERFGFKFATAIHPSAAIAHDVVVNGGTAVMAGAIINASSVIGANVIVNTGATVDHDCILSDGVHISPGANLAGGVVVGANAHIGIRASVIQRIQIGDDAIVGAGAVVIRDVPAGVTVVGNPARTLNPKHGMGLEKNKVLVNPEQSIRETLKAIDDSGLAIALVVDEQMRLLGTVTDGDVRRAILKQIDVASPISTIMNRQPATVTAAQDMQQIREFMLASTLKHAVVVDNENRVMDLVTVTDVLSVPRSAPDITDRELKAVAEVLRSRVEGSGSRVSEFEEKIAGYAGRRYAVAVNSGSSGLHLLVRALGLGPGDHVITTAFGLTANTNCLLHENVTPKFVDVDSRTYNIDPDKIGAAITPRTKAIIAAGTFGQPAHHDRIQEVASRRGLSFIVDACQSIGAEYKHRRASSHGVAAVFGFQANAQITTGEGGAIVTDDGNVADLCRSMRDEGCDPAGEGKVSHERLGFNYRLADLNSALGLAQLERIDEILEDRRQLAELYNGMLEGLDTIHCPYLAPETTRMSWFAYVVQLNEEFSRPDRDQIIAALRRQGVAVNTYFSAIHLQPIHRQRFGFSPGMFPTAEAVSDRTLALPFYDNLRQIDVQRVVKALSSAIESVSPSKQHASAGK